jgi:uncharacterized SAM-binding protein YcdF (DUF218 family)
LTVLTVSLILAAAAACPYAGRYLIIDRPLQPADAIVVLAGSQVERWLEAVDLYNEKVAPHVLLSRGLVEPAVMKLRERGVEYPQAADLARNAILQLGVPEAAVEIMPRVLDNTAQEAAAARAIVTRRSWRNLVVVTSKFHTRRSLYAFEREFKGTGVQIQIRGSRYDDASADGWWRRRADTRWVALEWLKLVLYRLGLRQ